MTSSELQKCFIDSLRGKALICSGERVLVAVSGGADSMALLHLCHVAAVEIGFEIIVAHFDHALRSESQQDARFVSEACDQLGVQCISERMDVRAWAKLHGLGIEEAARELRHAFLERCADGAECRLIALGHHRQDQVETVLHRVVRGTGLAGLAAMRQRRGRLIRPLLEFDRSDLRGFVAERQIGFREDPSNADETLTRNFLRHKVVPLLQHVNPAFELSLSRLAQISDLENDYWRVRLCQLSNEVCHPHGGWSVSRLLELHSAERRRFLVHLLERVVERQLGFEHVEAVEHILVSPRPQSDLDLPGVRALRRYDRLEIVGAEAVSLPGWELELQGPGSYDLPGGGEAVLSEAEIGGEEGLWSTCFPLEQIVFPLFFRTFRPGDRISLGCGEGHKKVKKVFAELQLEREVRTAIPQLVMGDEVLWIPGVRRSGKYRCREAQQRVLHVSIKKPQNIESLLVKSGCLC